MQIPQHVLNAMNKLNAVGYECYLVGGCVRDALMGIPPHDYDLTTSATPEQMLSVFSDCKVIETGLKHGTVTLLTEGGPVEITTYRVDGEYKDNRRPESVTFTPNLSEDLARRDFTVNAIAMDSEGQVVDLFGGKSDINAKIIRCVGDAEKRFNEDGLRILRALRFASVLDFSIDSKTTAAIIKFSHLLQNISAERVREELFKLICGKSSVKVLTQFAEVILPFLQPISREDLSDFLLTMDRLPPLAEIRIAALFASSRKADELKIALQKLKVSNKQLKSALHCFQVIQSPPTDATQTAWMIGEIGYRDFELYLDVAKACGKDVSSTQQTINRLKSIKACYTIGELAITGNDLIELGVKGKQVGDVLQSLFSAVAEEKIPNQKENLLNYAKNQVLF